MVQSTTSEFLIEPFFRPCGTWDSLVIEDPALKRWAILRGEGAGFDKLARWHFSCMLECMSAVRLRAFFIVGASSLIFVWGALARPASANSLTRRPGSASSDVESAKADEAKPNTDWQVIKI